MQNQSGAQSPWQSLRLLILGLVVTIIVLGITITIMAVGSSGAAATEERVNVLADSDDECVTCHANTTPGIIEQYGHSTMAAAEVTCRDCHEVEADYPGSVAH